MNKPTTCPTVVLLVCLRRVFARPSSSFFLVDPRQVLNIFSQQHLGGVAGRMHALRLFAATALSIFHSACLSARLFCAVFFIPFRFLFHPFPFFFLFFDVETTHPAPPLHGLSVRLMTRHGSLFSPF